MGRGAGDGNGLVLASGPHASALHHENEMLRDQMQKLESAHESDPPAPPTEAEKLRTRLKESQASLRRAQRDKERAR